MELALAIAAFFTFIFAHKAAIFFTVVILAIAYFWWDAAQQRNEIVSRQKAQRDAWSAKYFRPTNFADARRQASGGYDPYQTNNYK